MSIVQQSSALPSAALTPAGEYAAPGPTKPVLREGDEPGPWVEYEPKLQAAVLADTLALLDAECQRADAAEREVARLRALLSHSSWLTPTCAQRGVIDA